MHDGSLCTQECMSRTQGVSKRVVCALLANHLIDDDVGDMRQVEVASQAAQQDARGAEQQARCMSHGGIQPHMVPNS